MNLEQIEQLAASGESQSIEFKKTTADLHGGCESLCGMLNAGEDACLIIGVHGEKVIGQQVSDRTQQEIAQALKDFSPDPVFQWKVLPVRDKLSVVVIQGRSAPDKIPYFFRGKAYFRSGTSTSSLSRDRLKHLFFEQYHRKNPFDEQESEEVNSDCLDRDWIFRVVETGAAANRLPASAKTLSFEQLLEKLNLRKNGHLKQGSLIVFGKSSSNIFHQPRLMMARFKGTEKGEFLDHKMFSGNVFDLLDEGMMFLGRHLPLRGTFGQHILQRKDEPIIPMEALREAMVNAICHRDYADTSTSIHLAIYDDRVEIENRGGLMPGISLEDLKKEHTSVLRNSLIANLLYQAGYIEHWGQGTLKITQLCAAADLAEPEFIADKSWFKICFRMTPISQPLVVDDRYSRREKIIQFLSSQNRKVTLSELHSALPFTTRRMLQRDLQTLRKEKVVSGSFKGRSTVWSLFKRN